MNTDLINEQMMQVDAGYWAAQWPIKLQAGPFTFKGFEYQLEPMAFTGRRICYLKGRQSFGATIMEVLKDLHGMIMGKYKMGVAHIFPNMDEVGDFSKSIFKPLIAANKSSIGKYVKNVAGGTDTTTLKRVRDAMLFLRGARLGQKVGDSNENTSSKTSAFSCDKCVFDEVDFMDPEAIVKYIESMNMSPHKHEVYLGNPSHEDFGIDLIFQRSDQRYWFRKCSCSGLISTPVATTVRGSWTCAEKSFPGCVKIRSDGTGYIGCDKCGKEVPVWAGEGTGEWAPGYRDKSDYMYGYRASQLMAPLNDPAETLESYVNPPFGNLADVYRLKLGRAYSDKNEKLRKGDVLMCCGNDGLSIKHSGPCAMGVDVGKVKHVVIGTKLPKDKYEILRAIKIPEGRDGWNQIADLARMYNVKSTVIDIRPYEDEARAYQAKHGGGMTNPETFLCEYSDTQITDSAFNINTGVVKVHRTGIFDQTHRIISMGELILPRQCPEIEEFARQCCNCARFEEKDKRKNTVVHRYRPTGDRQEHFRNAMNYFVLACSGHRVGTVSRYKTKQYAEVDNEYERV
ncbi:hypothetical protein LCGC14_1405820 [marine sediment metagenome]|uniref:Phage terminase large subunit N-terminal domain-containing protein n=1 Tax=marine sediment metagenome TaxID=412755 RepID=A0A0F9MXB1_9ZZZZ